MKVNYIHIIDEDRNIAMLAKVWLQSMGYTLEVSCDSKSGWASLKESHADAVLLAEDLSDMDSREFCP